MAVDLKHQIKSALYELRSGDLSERASSLLSTLGYRSQKTAPLLPKTGEELLQRYDIENQFDPIKTLLNRWISADLLFQLTDAEVKNSLSGQAGFDFQSPATAIDDKIIQSYLFFAIELPGADWNRSHLAAITREVNRLFPMPVMMIFRHGDRASIGVINRRLNKKDEARDVLERVTLIKDIRLSQPHRAHIEILNDLALPCLRESHKVQNFVELHDAWREILNVSELNRRFFRELANWFFYARGQVFFPNCTTNDDRSVALIRLVTRLMFTWFLREKDLVPHEFFDQSELANVILNELPLDSKDNGNYYRAILQNLFFATLNTSMEGATREVEGRRWIGERKFQGIADNHGENRLLRFREEFRHPDEALGLFRSVPFLNGGLFECLDKAPKKDSKIVRRDGFTRDGNEAAQVPNDLFFGPEREANLNEVFGTKNKTYQVKSLIPLLLEYKWTVAENTPIEEELALDPELLGKVFENLLAAYVPETGLTARKQTGSFYTPREIVDYIVDETLICRLESDLIKRGVPDATERLRYLFAYGDYDNPKKIFTHGEADLLVPLLDSLKILDPACGSGAFPMGVLHKMTFVLGRLDPNNRRWKQTQLERAQRDLLRVEKLEDEEIRVNSVKSARKRIEEIETSFDDPDHELDYLRKLYLIENCLHGLDIQPIACQISKLRFFISLVIDQTPVPNKKNLGIRPLPNLETKFVAANTLISLREVGQMTLPDQEVEAKKLELKEVRRKHFHALLPETKEHWRQEDERIRGEIAVLLKADGWEGGAADKIAAWNPYDQNAKADFFDAEWMFGLKIEGGEGFDIVLGNPPYLRVQGLQETQPEFMSYYRDHYDSAHGNFDLYALFIEAGYKLLAPNGFLGYIVPHKFFQAQFGVGLREMLTQAQALREVVRFGAAQVFDEATTYTCLLLLARGGSSEFDLVEVTSLADAHEMLPSIRAGHAHPDYAKKTRDAPSSTEWNFALDAGEAILTRIKQHPYTLGEKNTGITKRIFQGFATSANNIYVLAEHKRFTDDNGVEVITCIQKVDGEEKFVEIEAALVKPFLMGKDIHRYAPPRARNVVIFPYHLTIDIKGDRKAEIMAPEWIAEFCPRGWTYLQQNKSALENREKGKMRRPDFYAYIYPKSLANFADPKILTPDIAFGCQMTVDPDGIFYHPTAAYSITFNQKFPASEKFLLGLLNSRVLWFFLTKKGGVLRGGYFRFFPMFLNPFSLPEPPPRTEQWPLERLVDYLLYLKAESVTGRAKLVSGFERLADSLVYELYFPEEWEGKARLWERLTPEDLPAEFDVPILNTVYDRLFSGEGLGKLALWQLGEIEVARIIDEAATPKTGVSK